MDGHEHIVNIFNVPLIIALMFLEECGCIYLAPCNGYIKYNHENMEINKKIKIEREKEGFQSTQSSSSEGIETYPGPEQCPIPPCMGFETLLGLVLSCNKSLFTVIVLT